MSTFQSPSGIIDHIVLSQAQILYQLFIWVASFWRDTWSSENKIDTPVVFP